jgi:hypothetical protein
MTPGRLGRRPLRLMQRTMFESSVLVTVALIGVTATRL